MDVLIHHLKNLPTPPDIAAYADDVGLGATNPKQYAAMVEVTHEFGLFSGLRMNVTKTKLLLAANDDHDYITTFLTGTYWADVPICATGVYLGVLFGRDIYLDEIYQDATKRLVDRLKALSLIPI